MLAQELECGIEVAVVGRHHEVECRVSKAVAAVTAVTKILDTGRMNGEIALAQLELAAARRLSPMCHCLVAAARWAAVVESKLWHPAAEPRQSEVIEIPVRCIGIGIETGAAIARSARRWIWLPAQRYEHGVDVTDRIGGKEWKLVRIVEVERVTDPPVGRASIGMDGWRQHGLATVGDQIADPFAVDIPRA